MASSNGHYSGSAFRDGTGDGTGSRPAAAAAARTAAAAPKEARPLDGRGEPGPSSRRRDRRHDRLRRDPAPDQLLVWESEGGA